MFDSVKKITQQDSKQNAGAWGQPVTEVHSSTDVNADSKTYHPTKPVKAKKSTLPILLGLLFLIALGGGAYWWWMNRDVVDESIIVEDNTVIEEEEKINEEEVVDEGNVDLVFPDDYFLSEDEVPEGFELLDGSGESTNFFVVALLYDGADTSNIKKMYNMVYTTKDSPDDEIGTTFIQYNSVKNLELELKKAETEEGAIFLKYNDIMIAVWSDDENIIDNVKNMADTLNAKINNFGGEEIALDANKNVVEEENLKSGSLAARCAISNGVWANGQCKANDCYDTDGRLGEDSKYVSATTWYYGEDDREELIKEISEETPESEYDSWGMDRVTDINLGLGPIRSGDKCIERDGKYFVQEATCPAVINSAEDIYDSYIEYECEDGCEHDACARASFESGLGGWLQAFYWEAELGDRDQGGILISSTGVAAYEWGDYNNGSAVLSEELYQDIYSRIDNMQDIFIDGEYDIDVETDYFSSDAENLGGYSIQYVRYPADKKLDEIDEDEVQNRSFRCNVNCPQEFVDLMKLIKQEAPYVASGEAYWEPSFVDCSNCLINYDLEKFFGEEPNIEPSTKDRGCYYQCMATEKPGGYMGQNRDNLFVADLDYDIDSDGDGMPDYNEKYIGSDINSSDTDRDGYTDLEEMNNGYNPIGDGKIMEYANEEGIQFVINQCGGNEDNIIMVEENYNCFGTEDESECLSMPDCAWSEFNYCRWIGVHCQCEDGSKINMTFQNIFERSCE